MSGYLAAITSNENLPKLGGLLRPDETVFIPLSGDRTLVYVSTTRSVNGSSIFQGYAIDHDCERLVFPGAAEHSIPDPSMSVDGSYFTGKIDDADVRFGADSYGFVTMSWFTDPAVSAVSDSYLTLIAVRKAFGLPCTPDEETIRGRMWLNSMSYQQLGQETYCKEIHFCTPGTELRYDVASGMITDHPCDLANLYQGTFSTHAEAVQLSATRMVRVFKSYAEARGIVSLSLSGGTDSRVCLAAALAAGIGDSLHIASKDNGTSDFAVAEELSMAFDFPLNKSRPEIQGRVTRRDPAATWAASSLGIYDALYVNNRFRHVSRPVFSVGGQGAEASKGNYGWRPVSNVSMPAEGLAQCHRALESIGVTPNDKWGTEWHYLAFRNAIHGGRATQNSEYVARPAAQIPLIGLSRSPLNELPTPRQNAPSVVLDMLITLSPEMAQHRFDDRRKDVSESFVAERLASLGGPIDSESLAPYSVVGAVLPSTGVSKSQTDIAEGFGFSGEMTGANLMPMASESLCRFTDLVPPTVHEHASSVSASTSATLKAASREAAAIGKLLALSTLD